MRKVVVYVPVDRAEVVRTAIADAGGGRIGNYSNVTFSSRGVARFKPEEGSNPTTGQVGVLQAVDEEKIEFVCDGETCAAIYEAIRKAHPDDEPAIDSWPIDIV